MTVARKLKSAITSIPSFSRNHPAMSWRLYKKIICRVDFNQILPMTFTKQCVDSQIKPLE